MLFLLLLTAFQVTEDGAPPDLVWIFTERDRADFAAVLSDEVRVRTDLRPVLYDYGYLSRQQVLMGFDKLHDRYNLRNPRITNSQSDANYSWLEIYLDVDLEDRRTRQVYQVVFAFHFKIAASQMVISRWVLQDIH